MLTKIVSDRVKLKPTNIHGLSNHPLYRVWCKIKDRVYNPRHESYHRYGGIGVTMCDEWYYNPVAFIEWALDNGWRKGLQIDKDIIPMSLGIEPKLYSPDMCSIVTSKQNNRKASYNVLIEYNGKKQTIVEWSEELNLGYSALYHRLTDRGYSVEEAFTKPIKWKINVQYECNGKSQTINEWCNVYNINRSTLMNRLKRGMKLSDAISKPIQK